MLGAAALVLSGCGPIVRVDDRGRATTVHWRPGEGFRSLSDTSVRGAATEQRVAVGRDASSRRGDSRSTGSSPPRIHGESSSIARRGSGTRDADPDGGRPFIPSSRIVLADADERHREGERQRQRNHPRGASTAGSSSAISEFRRGAAPSEPGDSPEITGRAGSIRMVAAPASTLGLDMGVIQQWANLDRLLGETTQPAEIHGLDVPPDAVVSAWAEDPFDLVRPRPGGIVVSFGEGMPHQVDGGIVGRLRDRGWLAIEVQSVAEEPTRLADAVSAACDALDELTASVSGFTEEFAHPSGRPLVLLGFGDGVAEALGVLEATARTPVAVVLVSHPDTDSLAVQQLDRSLMSARIPVLHLRSADSVGGTASVKDLVISGGLNDRQPTQPGLTGWTYARRPGPGVAWLPMLVDPVADWVDRASRHNAKTARAATGPE